MSDTRFDPEKVRRYQPLEYDEMPGEMVVSSEFDQLHSLYRQREWISCAESLPSNESKVLVVWWNRDQGPYRDIAWRVGENWMWATGYVIPDFIRITHWQPLPEPPAAVKEEM